ncbi:MAG: L7Ae/L30e/S12e/Gadd45 family ribosomal protein [Evtepia gabavorous]
MFDGQNPSEWEAWGRFETAWKGERPRDADRSEVCQKGDGAKQVTRALKNGTARRVFLAQDADPRVTEPIELLCREQGTETEAVATMAALGSACGIAVGSAVAAVVD